MRASIVIGSGLLLLTSALASASDTPKPPSSGPAPSLIETPLCKFFQKSPCEFRFGAERRLRIPADLLHPAGVDHVRAPRVEYEIGLVRTTWGGLRALEGWYDPASGDETLVQIVLSSEPRTEVGALEGRLRVFAPKQIPMVTAARAQGDATIEFTDRNRTEWEVVFRDGRQVTERQCTAGYDGRVGICSVLAVQGGLLLNFWHSRRVEASTEEAVALVTMLLDTFIVEGPKLRKKADE